MNWSQYIEQDLQGRLRKGQPLPCEPTLERLAMHYRVSTRPVRTALQRLRQQGWLIKGTRQRKRRLSGSKRTWNMAGRAGESKVDPPTDYVEAIGRHLVTRSLEGRETFVREQAMARQFAVSTTTVRETFHRLAGLGVIEHIPRRGWRLRSFRQKDMDDFAVVRQSLECMALRLGWETLQTPDGRAAMEAFLAGNVVGDNPADPPRIDDGFHAWIIGASQNRYIQDFFSRFGRYYRFLFEWEATDRASGIETVRQHRRILQAILADDPSEAHTALAEHLLRQHPVLKQVMDFNQREQMV